MVALTTIDTLSRVITSWRSPTRASRACRPLDRVDERHQERHAGVADRVELSQPLDNADEPCWITRIVLKIV